MPVEVLGFDTVPDAGELVRVVENDRKARQLANERGHRLKTEALARRQRRRVSLEYIFDQPPGAAAVQELNLLAQGATSPARWRPSRTRSPSCRRRRSRST